MVRLFVSDRIFNEGQSFSGAIAVNEEGKIDELLTDQSEIDSWLSANSHVEVKSSRKTVLSSVFQNSNDTTVSLYHLDFRLQWLGYNARSN